jgi:tRNA G18 (ribose-2'-O)-methylase SpoU
MRVERVEHVDDPRLADYRNLRDANLRADSGLFLAESRLGVRRLLVSRFRPRSVFLTESALRALRGGLESLGDDTPVYLAAREVLSRIAGYPVHRGCLAAAERGNPLGLDDILEGLAPGPRRLVVLEDVTNPENVGGIFRNAAAFGADAVLLSERCADPLYRKAIRVGMGASLRVPFARLPSLPSPAGWIAALDRLGAVGFTRVALSLRAGAVSIASLEAGALPDRVALLVGTEDTGLSTAALDRCDREVTIPMAPGIDSLNVATASGIALHRLAGLGDESSP